MKSYELFEETKELMVKYSTNDIKEDINNMMLKIVSKEFIIEPERYTHVLTLYKRYLQKLKKVSKKQYIKFLDTYKFEDKGYYNYLINNYKRIKDIMLSEKILYINNCPFSESISVEDLEEDKLILQKDKALHYINIKIDYFVRDKDIKMTVIMYLFLLKTQMDLMDNDAHLQYHITEIFNKHELMNILSNRFYIKEIDKLYKINNIKEGISDSDFIYEHEMTLNSLKSKIEGKYYILNTVYSILRKIISNKKELKSLNYLFDEDYFTILEYEMQNIYDNTACIFLTKLYKLETYYPYIYKDILDTLNSNEIEVTTISDIAAGNIIYTLFCEDIENFVKYYNIFRVVSNKDKVYQINYHSYIFYKLLKSRQDLMPYIQNYIIKRYRYMDFDNTISVSNSHDKHLLDLGKYVLNNKYEEIIKNIEINKYEKIFNNGSEFFIHNLIFIINVMNLQNEELNLYKSSLNRFINNSAGKDKKYFCNINFLKKIIYISSNFKLKTNSEDICSYEFSKDSTKDQSGLNYIILINNKISVYWACKLFNVDDDIFDILYNKDKGLLVITDGLGNLINYYKIVKESDKRIHILKDKKFQENYDECFSGNIDYFTGHTISKKLVKTYHKDEIYNKYGIEIPTK